MNRVVKIITMIACIACMGLWSACTREGDPNDPSLPTGDDGTGWNSSFPQKKVRKITVEDYGTFDFFWNGNRLDEISFSSFNGIPLGAIYYEYDANGRIAKTKYQERENSSITDGYTYTYDSYGRLIEQEIQIPYEIWYYEGGPEPIRETLYKPTTYTYTYANGHVSKIRRKCVYMERSEEDYNTFVELTNEENYECTWAGDNMTRFSYAGQIAFDLQYDDKNTPLQFPMGIEILHPFWGVFQYEHESPEYMDLLFGIASAGINNVTNMSQNEFGQIYTYLETSYTYTNDGYPQSITVTTTGAKGTTLVYTFEYYN